MKSIKCKLIIYRDKFYIVYADGRLHKVGDSVLVPSFITVGKITTLLSGYDQEGMCYIDNLGGSVSLLVKPLQIIAAVDSEIEPRFKNSSNIDMYCYIYEIDNNIIRNYDNTVLVTFSMIDYAKCSSFFKPSKILFIFSGIKSICL
jgi:hypothetical protein